MKKKDKKGLRVKRQIQNKYQISMENNNKNR